MPFEMVSAKCIHTSLVHCRKKHIGVCQNGSAAPIQTHPPCLVAQNFVSNSVLIATSLFILSNKTRFPTKSTIVKLH